MYLYIYIFIYKIEANFMDKNEPNSKMINNIDNISLEYNKYSVDILEENIEKLSLWKLLKTQILDPPFCVKYILNDDFASCDEDTYIVWQDVIRLQPHILKKDLFDVMSKIIEKPTHQEKAD